MVAGTYLYDRKTASDLWYKIASSEWRLFKKAGKQNKQKIEFFPTFIATQGNAYIDTSHAGKSLDEFIKLHFGFFDQRPSDRPVHGLQEESLQSLN